MLHSIWVGMEHILSPDKINFLVYEDTLVEEHIMGIAGDVFIKTLLDDCSETEKSEESKNLLSLTSA
jgi:hypothetical protein